MIPPNDCATFVGHFRSEEAMAITVSGCCKQSCFTPDTFLRLRQTSKTSKTAPFTERKGPKREGDRERENQPGNLGTHGFHNGVTLAAGENGREREREREKTIRQTQGPWVSQWSDPCRRRESEKEKEKTLWQFQKPWVSQWSDPCHKRKTGKKKERERENDFSDAPRQRRVQRFRPARRHPHQGCRRHRAVRQPTSRLRRLR